MKDWSIAWEVISLESFAQTHFWYTTGDAAASVGINWETICFILGMMVMVEGMAASGRCLLTVSDGKVAYERAR